MQRSLEHLQQHPIPTAPRALAKLTALLLGLSLTSASLAVIEVRDDTDRPVRLDAPARRIVSLAPHVTEQLFAAGAGDRVVGVVQYSDHPPAAQALPRVGGYSNLDLEAVLALKPDLIIGWHSGNRAHQLERLDGLGIPLYLSEPRKLDDIAHGLERLGELAGTPGPAREAARRFRERHATLAARYRQAAPVSMFYQLWNQPLMTVNDQHLIADVIRLCGGRNVFASLSQLTPTVNEEAVLAADPMVIVASGMGEGKPEWLDRWRRWPALQAVRLDGLHFIPPDLIQRHTPRILDGAERLCGFLEQARTKTR